MNKGILVNTWSLFILFKLVIDGYDSIFKKEYINNKHIDLELN